MKYCRFFTYFLFMIMTLSFIGCEENIPRNRPVLDYDATAITDEPQEEEPSSELTIERPSGAIIIQPNHCACQNAKPISLGNCEAICSEKNSGANPETRLLYFETQTTAEISATDIEDIWGFCNTLPRDGSLTASCSIEVKDEKGNTNTLAFEPEKGATSFSVEVGGLSEDETYRLSIIENNSGARSTTIQMRLISDLIEDNIGGPLALMPVNQYSCLFRTGVIDSTDGSFIIEDVNRFHFYFISATRPEPLKASSLQTVNCHDMELYGTTPINSPLLEETTNVFTVWNREDPRFYNLGGEGKLRVHELLEQNIRLQGQTLSSSLNLFFELEWPSGIDDGDTGVGSEEDEGVAETISNKLGYYMTPFIDSETYKAYCPTQQHYYSNSALFKAMREIIGIDTEGLYAAKQDNVCDFILIRETVLKKIWFYIEGGQHIQPTSDTVAGKKIQFYWPADPSSPYIKKSHQRVYTLKQGNEISCGSASVPDDSSGSSGSDGIRSNYPPHDKRIGCIPKLEN